MGYHLKKIDKGVYGEFSKIKEEIEELQDAHKQNNRILEIVEITDLLGAIEGYLLKNNLTLDDAIAMMRLTKKAFQDGDRK
jgi:phosphoribosyl-ATP pyrophosphohydrolase